MTGGPRPSIFLERKSYRKRRMMDALRLLPILGLMLWMLPLFWPRAGAVDVRSISASTVVTYVFIVWLILIIAAFALSLSLRDGSDPSQSEDDTGGA